MADNVQIWADKLRTFDTDARQNMEDGALTKGYKANAEEMCAILNRALCSEYVAFLQYRHHYFMASDIHRGEIAEEFKQHSEDELNHATEIAGRIQMLGGVPIHQLGEIERVSPIRVDYGHNLRNMMEEDLIDERAAIDFYREIVRYAGNNDPVTREMFEDILAVEEEHADDWANYLFEVDPSTNKVIPDLHQAVMSQLGAAFPLPPQQSRQQPGQMAQ